MNDQDAHRAALERLFDGTEHHVTLFRYSITHGMAEFAIHDGFPFRRWPLYCRGAARIDGVLSGGPYSFSVHQQAGTWQLNWGAGQLQVLCDGFSLGEFGTAQSPELASAALGLEHPEQSS